MRKLIKASILSGILVLGGLSWLGQLLLMLLRSPCRARLSRLSLSFTQPLSQQPGKLPGGQQKRLLKLLPRTSL
jgi:hypothetical protein